MKAKLTLLSLLGLLTGSLVCLGQDAATNTQPTTASAVVAPVVVIPAATNAQTELDPNAVIPLVVMEDVGLIDAIKNLARLAKLNYVLDPKVPYGGTDSTGKPVAQPTISIRWEKLTAQQALTALLNNYNLEIVEDQKTTISRIKMKDPAAQEPLITKIIQLNYASPTNLQSVVQASLTDPKREKVIGDPRSSQLVVVATEKTMKTVDEIVASMDLAPRQVLIETKLLETSKNPQTLRGINWSGTLAEQKVSFGNNTFTPPPGVSANNLVTVNAPKLLMDTAKGFNPATAFLDADGVSAVLSFLNKDNDTQVISTPRAVTLDNEQADLSVTRSEPIFKNTAGTQGSPGGSEVTYTNLGTILRVTPRISAEDKIQLHVIPEVSSVGPTRQKVVAGTVNQADSYDIRRIETRVLIPSGNTLVLGGLVSSAINNGYTKVPVMGDVPIVGRAFRSSSKEQLRKNLLVFITPTIVHDGDFSPAPSEFLKSRPDEEPEEKLTSYRSAKPYDWSKAGDPTAVH